MTMSSCTRFESQDCILFRPWMEIQFQSSLLNTRSCKQAIYVEYSGLLVTPTGNTLCARAPKQEHLLISLADR